MSKEYRYRKHIYWGQYAILTFFILLFLLLLGLSVFLTTQSHIGFIAQEMEQVVPEVVITNKVTGMKAVNYDGILPIVVEAMKELNSKVEVLAAENAALNLKVEELKKELLEKSKLNNK